ncbi:hypothetical protein KL918_004147 [Ogataea parapolymorpha]|nr:hypothetical protein KL918_004147 [Ogataea parapolymorpha]KAG7867974.1 hypothetical protein KL916_005344 [Ogataea parapolymorpha]
MKRRGVRRACDACHLRKQRCDGLQPCFRCSKSDKLCSYGEEQLPGASEVVHLMSTVLSSLGTIEQKIDLLGGISDPPAAEPSPPLHRPPVAIQTISLRGAPMSTVQSAYSMAGNGMAEINSTASSVRSPLPLLHQLYRTDQWCCDPVSLGILSLQDAQHLVDLYFEQMHNMAPLLTKSIHSNAADLRQRLLTIPSGFGTHRPHHAGAARVSAAIRSLDAAESEPERQQIQRGFCVERNWTHHPMGQIHGSGGPPTNKVYWLARRRTNFANHAQSRFSRLSNSPFHAAAHDNRSRSARGPCQEILLYSERRS